MVRYIILVRRAGPSGENSVDTVDSHKQTHSRNVDRYRTMAEFTARINK